jgi:hypothetical protein
VDPFRSFPDTAFELLHKIRSSWALATRDDNKGLSITFFSKEDSNIQSLYCSIPDLFPSFDTTFQSVDRLLSFETVGKPWTKYLNFEKSKLFGWQQV